MLKVFSNIFALGVMSVGPAQAQSSPLDFFAGKKISVIIGYAAGGTYDTIARLLTRHMGKHIPGQPAMVPQNTPGVAVRSILHLYAAAPNDGTALGMLARTYPIEPVFNPENAKYLPARFNPIGSTSTEVSVGVVWHTHRINSLKDLEQREITTGSTGFTDDTGRFALLTNNLAGTRIRVVTGYPGGNDITAAMERGEVDARFGWSWGSLKSRSKPWLDDKKINIIVQMALEKAPDLPDVPLVMEFAKNSLDRQALELLMAPQALAWPLVAPPGVPAERVTQLRRAFDATMRDSAFLSEATKMRIDVEPVTGEAMQKIVEQLASFDRKVVDRALQLIAVQ